ncbi:MAG: gamma-glutamylcyclotransferase family protein [Candidatus Kariarchaeaceae archaeon]|jgi:gamma-glutamylcyclotransferase (GGCT)/AIG2-like uncharacterized protein YtfP
MVLLAVYGTLKQGNHNHDVKLARDPVFAGIVDMKAKMYTNGRYPMLVKDDGGQSIVLEVYDITDAELRSIDDLEEPFDYHREQISVADLEGVWVYYYTPGVPPKEFRFVESGNFSKDVEW